MALFASQWASLKASGILARFTHHAFETQRVVRVAWEPVLRYEGEPRILLCVTESPGSRGAVAAVAARSWPKSTEIRLFTVVNPDDYSLVPLLDEKINRIRLLHQRFTNELEHTPAYTSSIIREGEPVECILDETREWQPAAIFMGASNKGWLRRLLTGSASRAVAARTECPVLVSEEASIARLP